MGRIKMVKKVEENKKENNMIGILVALIILVLCVVAVILFINNKKNDMVKNSDIENIIKEGKTAIIYVENSDSKKCEKCSDIKKYLNEEKINYEIYDVNKNTSKEYKKMLQTLTINPSDFNYPAVIYIKEGRIYSNIINVNDTKIVKQFIKDYDLTLVK